VSGGGGGKAGGGGGTGWLCDIFLKWLCHRRMLMTMLLMFSYTDQYSQPRRHRHSTSSPFRHPQMTEVLYIPTRSAIMTYQVSICILAILASSPSQGPPSATKRHGSLP